MRTSMLIALLQIPGMLLVIGIYSWIRSARLEGRMRTIREETCCRRCGHILRGISEPRCPECGEHI